MGPENQDFSSDMNHIEITPSLGTNSKWSDFAGKLNTAMLEYPLDGVTVLLREMTSAEMASDPDGELLTFDQEIQRFELAVDPSRSLPPAWSVADRIDHFLNPG